MPDAVQVVYSDHAWFQHPDDKLLAYNKRDVVATVRAARALRRILEAQKQSHFYDNSIWPTVAPSMRMQARGLPYSPEARDLYRRGLRAELKETDDALRVHFAATYTSREAIAACAWQAVARLLGLQGWHGTKPKALQRRPLMFTRGEWDKLAKHVPAGFNPNSKDQLRAWLFGPLALREPGRPYRTETGAASVDQTALQHLLQRKHRNKAEAVATERATPIIHLLMHRARLQKIDQDYLDPEVRYDDARAAIAESRSVGEKGSQAALGRTGSHRTHMPEVLQNGGPGDVGLLRGVSVLQGARAARVYPRIKILGAECISGDSYLLTSRGFRTIEQLWERRTQLPEVWNGERFVEPIQLVQFESDGFRLQLEHGYQLKGSSNHPVWTKRGWVQLADLCLDDELLLRPFHESLPGSYVLPKFTLPELGHRAKAFTQPTLISWELAEFIGIWLADGTLHDNGSWSVRLSSSRPCIQKRFAEIGTKVFGIEPRVHALGVDFSSKALVDWMRAIGCGGHAREKKIPPAFMQGPEQAIRALLRGLTTDSHLNNGMLHYGTQSPEMQEQIRMLLLGLGIISTKLESTSATKLRVPWRFTPHFMSLVGVIDPDRTPTIDALVRAHRPEQQAWLQVRTITPWSGQVYDLKMPESSPPQYIANGLLVHNSGRYAYADPPVHSWPDEIRHLVRARPGHVIVGLDYSAVESRVFSNLTKDTTDLRTFEQNRLYPNDKRFDIHITTCCDFFDWDFPRFNQQNSTAQKASRNFAKVVRYGVFQYGGDPSTVRSKVFCPCIKCAEKAPPTLEVTPERRVEVTRRWFARHPQVVFWRARISEHLQRNKWLENPFGRRRYFAAPFSKELEREGWNWMIQSSALDIIQRALVQLDADGAPLILQHHDALYFEVPEVEAPALTAHAREVMERPVAEFGGFVFPVDSSQGPSWGELA